MTNPRGLQEETSLWDDLVPSCSCPMIHLHRPAGVGIDSPVPSSVHALDWTVRMNGYKNIPRKKMFALDVDESSSSESAKRLKEGIVSDVLRGVTALVEKKRMGGEGDS